MSDILDYIARMAASMRPRPSTYECGGCSLCACRGIEAFARWCK